MGNCVGRQDSDSVAHRKKTDAPSPDVAVKDNISDSGIEASDETERSPSSNGDLSPISLLHPDSPPLESDSGVEAASPAAAAAAAPPQDESSRDNEVIDVSITDGLTVCEEDDRSKMQPNGRVLTGGLEDQNEEAEEEKEELESPPPAWSFPPVLDDFDLMSSDVDPTQLEEIFEDIRLIEVKLRLVPDGPGLGISIAGGYGCPLGDLPIVIKRVLPSGLAEQDGKVKAGDELVAINETLLVGTTKDFAVDHLSRVRGHVRLLVLQDD